MRLVESRSPLPDEWDSIWRECPYATYFHSREWAELWASYTQGRLTLDARLLQFEDGKRLLLPLMVRGKFGGLIKRWVSSPGNTFGGWISRDELNTTHITLATKYIQQNLSSLQLRLNPYNESLVGFRLGRIIEDSTRVLRLTEGFDATIKTWTKGHRSAANKAMGLGVTIRCAASLEDWRAYYAVYQDSLRRWGDRATTRYDWSLFEQMERLNTSNIRLWLAMFGGNVIGGALCLYSPRHIAYWHGSAIEEYFHLRPVHLLIREIIRDASNKNYDWFDFNPSSGIKGVDAFKKGFGTTALPCPVLTHEHFPFVLLREFRCVLRRYTS